MDKRIDFVTVKGEEYIQLDGRRRYFTKKEIMAAEKRFDKLHKKKK